MLITNSASVNPNTNIAAPEPDIPAGREVPATPNTANAAARPAITGPEASAPMSTPAPDIMNAAEPGNIAKAANALRTAPSAAPTASATTSPINVITLPTVKAFTVTATVPGIVHQNLKNSCAEKLDLYHKTQVIAGLDQYLFVVILVWTRIVRL